MPASMDETKTSKQERNVSRKEKQAFRQAMQNDYTRELMNDLEGKPEEVSLRLLNLLAESFRYIFIFLISIYLVI